MGLLDDIVARKRIEIAELRANGVPPSTRFHNLGRTTIDVVAALSRPIGAPLRLISEIKFKSPSAGELSKKLDAASRALAYAHAGASMVSVLCDSHFFGGSFDDLGSARAALDEKNLVLPLLCKEFVLDVAQMDWARARGADAILLIARILDRETLALLVDAAIRRGVEPLVEVATLGELEIALATSARLVGVNARDLDTLAIDSKQAADVVAKIPPDRVAIHLSGVKNVADVAKVAASRADAALIGEVLMREEDPAELLARFVDAAFG